MHDLYILEVLFFNLKTAPPIVNMMSNNWDAVFLNQGIVHHIRVQSQSQWLDVPSFVQLVES